MGALVDAEPAHSVLGQRPLEPGLVGALGQPEAALPAEAPAVRAGAGVDLQAQALRGRQHRQHGVGRRGRRERDPPLALGLLEGPQRVAAGLVEQLEGAPVSQQLGFAGGPALGRHVGRVGFGGADPPLDQEAAQALADSGVLELVGEHRGHRQRQVPRDIQQRQVGADHRVEEPLLAERVGPEALDIGHVRVEDDRQIAALHRRSAGASSGMADGDEVQGPLEVVAAAGRSPKRRSPG